MNDSDLKKRLERFEKELETAQRKIRAQENMISSLMCSLQATYAMLISRDIISNDLADQNEFRKHYISNMAKMDQANAGLNESLRQR